MKEISIVPMKEEHLSQVELIEKACFFKPWSRESILTDINNPRAVTLAALYGNEIAGFLCAFCVCDEGTVNLIAVKDKFRGQGVASALFSNYIICARSRGIIRLFLEVRESNKSAISLYRKFGFVNVGRRKKIYLNPVEDAILMMAQIENNI